jgi:hypothetical protein
VTLTREGRHEVEPGIVDVPRASPAEAAEALTAFVAGVDARDEDALAALAPSDDTTAGQVLAGIAANARSLDLRGVTARYVDQVGTVATDGSWSGIVEMDWQVATFDPEPSRAEVVVTFAPDDDVLGIAGFGAGPTDGSERTPLWLRGELAVARSRGVLVMVDGDRAEAAAVEQRVRRGIEVVQRVLPGGTGPVVVEVPASAADLDETLGARPGTYAGIAAVTAVIGSSTDDGAPVHVLVNPDVTAGLRRAGAQVVMSHELVHLATGAARSAAEPWLLEGFADYVALRGSGLPDRTTLGRAIEAARRDDVPGSLPTAADFDTRSPDLQARYEEAWLACRVIAERSGEGTLVEVYDAALRGEPLGRVLRRGGLPVDELTRAWREELRSLAD